MQEFDIDVEAQKLLNYKRKVDDADKIKLQNEGALNAIMSELKKKFNVENIDELSEKTDEQEQKLFALEDEIKEGMASLANNKLWE
jgi:hypothetical protein